MGRRGRYRRRGGKSSKAQVTPQNKRKQSPKKSSPGSSNSDTSPFKGFESTGAPKLFGSLLSDIPAPVASPEHRDDIFDKLIDDEYKSHFNRNIKTYSNKKKNPLKENNLLEFQDCKNRDAIVQWLNDNRNAFGQLTQTQNDVVPNCSQTQDLDMPSVSQQITPKMNRSLRKTTRSPYKLRARSLDIQIKKNRARGRNERHSLAGETPELEDYKIEEFFTEEDNPVSVQKDAAIIDLMEDEYLNNIDEMFQSDKKNLSGWDRIKDINKKIKKKEPKQLKITLQTSPIRKENMEKIMKEKAEVNNVSEEKFTMKNAIQVGKNFVMILKKLSSRDGTKELTECQPIINELIELIKISKTETNIHTTGVQTENELCDADCQTSQFSVCNTGIQTEISQCICQTSQPAVFHKSVQTGSCQVTVEVQTENPLNLIPQKSAMSNSTPELSEVFDIDFDTEDIRKQIDDAIEKSTKGHETNAVETGGTQCSVLAVSAEPKSDSNKGVKRSKSASPDCPSKRPCAHFIKDDLSVAFDSCAENEPEEKRKKLMEFSEESDDVNYDEYLDNLCKRYEKGNKENVPLQSPAPPKTRTQEQIEELENMIDNATKSNRPAPPKRETSPVKQTSKSSLLSDDDLDYFKPYLTKEKSLKKIPRNLFDSPKNASNKFSGSLFANDANETVVTNKTITPTNVEGLLEQVNEFIRETDKEVQEILEREANRKKLNILENVTVKPAVMASQSSDVVFDSQDIVESTPQKSFPSFSKQRKDTLLDITLPPPLEFQDSEKNDLGSTRRKVPEPLTNASPSRRPLADINKITSTPQTQRFDSEKIALSPIPHNGKSFPKLSPALASQNENSKFSSKPPPKKPVNQFELAHQSKFSPLTIIKKPPPPNIHRITATPKQQKSILSYVTSSQASQESQNSQCVKRKPCVACTRVSKDKVIAISSMTNKKLASYSTSFTSNVTHLIVSVDEKNWLKDHTIKFVSAVASGAWILSFGWVQECLHRNRIVSEESYEVLDVSGIAGPKKARLTRKSNPLLKGYKIHAATPFASTTQQEVENVIKLLGGKIAPRAEDLLDKNGYICLVVTEARATQEFELYEAWLEALRVVTVDIEWLSRSVGQYQLLSLRPFTLCSDDYLENLGYPSELTASAPYSFSQPTIRSGPSS